MYYAALEAQKSQNLKPSLDAQKSQQLKPALGAQKSQQLKPTLETQKSQQIKPTTPVSSGKVFLCDLCIVKKTFKNEPDMR